MCVGVADAACIHLHERLSGLGRVFNLPRTADRLGNIYLDVTAWQHIVDGRSHLTGAALQNWPLSVAEHNDTNSAASKYLLVAQVLVRGKENLKSGILSGG